MSFKVVVVEGDKPFTFKCGSSVVRAFGIIRNAYPKLEGGRLCVITTVQNQESQTEEEEEEDLGIGDKFPESTENTRVIFIPTKPIIPCQSQVTARISKVNFHNRIRKHRQPNLDLALEEDLPFKICCKLSEYAEEFANILELGQTEYDLDVDTFIANKHVGISEVAVWSITNVYLDFVVSSLSGLCTVYRNKKDPWSRKGNRADDVVYVNDAHCFRIESKAKTEKLNPDELTNKLTPEAWGQFPRGSRYILGFCASLDTIRVYKIFYDEQVYSWTLERSFLLTNSTARVEFLGYLCKYMRYLVTVEGPYKKFHLVPGYMHDTPNGHLIVYTHDANGSYLLKVFNAESTINFNYIQAIFNAKCANIQWGEVLNIDEKSVKLTRIGYQLSQAFREKLISKDDVVRQVRAGLDQLHAMGYAHCDVKVDNVFVDCKMLIAFLDDLEYVSLVDDPFPVNVTVPRGFRGTTAKDLDEAMFVQFKNEVMQM